MKIEDEMSAIRSGYWWECTKCDRWHKNYALGDYFCKLIKSGWDQSLLVEECECGKGEQRLTFYKSKSSKQKLILQHAVGLVWDGDSDRLLNPDGGIDLDKAHSWVPMLWEWTYEDKPEPSYFDFKYVSAKRLSPQSLVTITSLTLNEMGHLFGLYEKRTGEDIDIPWFNAGGLSSKY